MSIMVRCPNGHVLKVKDSFAGKSGLCPICKARIEVPDPHASLSEEDIADLLGVPTQPHYANPSASGIALHMPETRHETATEVAAATTKECVKCHQQIAAGTHICPFCKTYIANVHDF